MELESKKTFRNHSFHGGEKKKTKWNDVLTIILLVIFPIVGLVLMWMLASWAKKTKIIITVVIIIISLFGALVGWILLSEARERFEELEKKEFVIETKISEIGRAAEMIYDEEGNYSNVSCNHSYLISLCSYLAEKIGMKPIIYSHPDMYCAYIKLPGGEYYCLEGREGGSKAEYTTIHPGGPGYCNGVTFICP